MGYTAKVGAYISWQDADEKTKYGKIKTVSGTTIVVEDYETGKDLAAAEVATYTKIQTSHYARMKIRAKPNAWEVAENVVVAGIYHPLVARNKLMDAEFYSFVLSDILHEFIFKGLTESIADMLLPSNLKGDDATAFFATEDFSDALRKAVFIVPLQQIFQKALFKKNWGHQLMSNSIGGLAILAVSNIADRMWSASADDGYTYP